MIEVEFEDRIVCIEHNALCKLQAHWRGTVTRKRLALLQEDYLQLVKEIEENDDLQVNWKYGSLSLPTLISKKKLKGAEESAKRNTQKQELVEQQPEPKENGDNTLQTKERTSHPTPKGALHPDSSCRSSELREKLANKTDENANTKNFKEAHRNQSDITKVDTGKNKTANETISENDAPEVENSQSLESFHEEHMSMQDEKEDEFIKMLHEKRNEVTEEELESARGHIAMELLWVQQAIASRKQYLRLKDQMVGAIPES